MFINDPHADYPARLMIVPGPWW